MKQSRTIHLISEIVICFFLILALSSLFNLFNADGLWSGVLSYVIAASVIILYILKVEKKPLSYIGLKKVTFSDIPNGLMLGLFMFVVQQIPLLLMKVDYSAMAYEPDWKNIVIVFLYCFICVGFTEELIFRGFILQKTSELCSQKTMIVIINCLLFYAVHWPPVRFVFGEFFNIAVNTIILCVYFYKSQNKSIVPLMIAHGFYDFLTVYLLPAFLFYLFK